VGADARRAFSLRAASAMLDDRSDQSAEEASKHMLQLRPNCECCNRDLPPDSSDAFICSFECTFCRTGATDVLHGRCPNCRGELVTRPRRGEEMLAKHPSSTERVYNPAGCAKTA